MSQFQQLLEQTSLARQRFIELPLIQQALTQGVSKPLYLEFLGQAYHHVKHTVPLLELAAAACGSSDSRYQHALLEYVSEERGHEEWILEDVDALGGDAEAVRNGSPRFPCKIMVGHAYYLVDRVSPYGLLGMIHGGNVIHACGQIRSIDPLEPTDHFAIGLQVSHYTRRPRCRPHETVRGIDRRTRCAALASGH
jgi:hypothetical protein